MTNATNGETFALETRAEVLTYVSGDRRVRRGESDRREVGSGFTRFLDDGRICLTNNAAERALRGIVLGRKSWLFAGSDRGGEPHG